MHKDKVINGLQLGVEGLGAKGLAKHPRCPAGDQRVFDVDALLALLKDKPEELLFDGSELTSRAIKERKSFFDKIDEF